MALSALKGNWAQVDSFFRNCKSVLEREMGVEPSPCTVEACNRHLDLASSIPCVARFAARPGTDSGPVQQ